MVGQVEANANGALGALLRGMLRQATIRSEHAGLLVGHAGRPDLLITGAGASPVVIEAEYEPAATVEKEARSRLHRRVVGESRPIEAVVALRYPAALKDAYEIEPALKGADLAFAAHHADGTRFPRSGWLEGSVEDLSDLVRLVGEPQESVRAAAAAMEQGIEEVAWRLDELSILRPFLSDEIAARLGLDDSPQTRRMAGAILANAVVFHHRLSGILTGVRPPGEVCDSVVNAHGAIRSAWNEILAVNYWPIFAIARDFLSHLLPGDGSWILRRLCETAAEIDTLGVANAHHLTGRIFQRLIADRKYLATFYTLPPSASLLARLAVSLLDDLDWSDADRIGRLRVGDFACGTGALLSAVYEQIAARHERAGGDAAALHRPLMEAVLYGCDVMPSAVHITGSTLSGLWPDRPFELSRLYTVPYGRQGDGGVQIGSLELLQSSQLTTLFNTSDPALRTGSAGEETAARVSTEVRDGDFDLVIMNPPFTRAGSDWEGSKRKEDYIKQFRGLSTDLGTQKEMAARLKGFARDSCYHGYAGIASAFVALADRKVKPGGVVALVLPLSVAGGESWKGVRRLFAAEYTDLTVLSIAATGSRMSFSSDTGMAECLVVAKKRKPEGEPGRRSVFVSLRERPHGFAEAAAIASGVRRLGGGRRIEDGPYGGSRLTVGEDLRGDLLSAPCDDSEIWSAVRLGDPSLAQTAHALTQSSLWLPGHEAVALPIVRLASLGQRGLHHRNITGPAAPYDRGLASPTSTFPALWNHHARRETRLVVEPDLQLYVRVDREERASEVWATASRSHVNLDFTFGSQPLAVAFTERACIGGRVWPTVRFADRRFDYLFALWGNSSLGLLAHWWLSSRQQSSKAGITVSSMDRLSVLDLRTLDDAQLEGARRIFDEFRGLDLQPAFLADTDPNRALLDRRVVCDLLGFGEDTFRGVRRLAGKWCAEPSVHGGKKRPEAEGSLIYRFEQAEEYALVAEPLFTFRKS